MSGKKNIVPRNRNLKFIQDDDQFQNEQNEEELLGSDSDDKSQQNPSEQKKSEKKSEDQQYKQGQSEYYSTLDELIFHLNEEDHSEDEGIQDYKIGGYHPCHVGEVLINRYVLVQKLGWGHFSTVWLAKDFKHGNYTAVKIMKSSPHYLQASYDQVQILQKVANKAYDPLWIKSLRHYELNKTTFDRDDCHVLNLLNSFLYKGPYGNHFCMVFQILGVNLLEVLKRYDYKGLPLHLVKQITRQVLMGLDFINRICRVIHTDLKPQNVLLCLTPEEIRKIVEDGQLSNKQLYRDRLRLYRKKYHLGPDQQTDQEQQQSQPQLNVQIQMKIKELELKLEEEENNKNQRKNIRRKIKKWQQKGEQQAQEHKKQSNRSKKQNSGKSAKQLFSAFDTKLVLDKGPKLEPGFKVKIADLGNACWQHHHFATEIQTRQYRGPEVLTGSKYNLSADMWSLACMTFQMLTGQLLFNPRKDNSETFGKNDDHLAQMMELLGRFPKKFSLRGAKSKKYFGKDGALQRIPKLQNWSLKDVMIAKYRFKDDQAQEFQDFMAPMLQCYPEKRLLADQMLKHPWLYKKSQDYLLQFVSYHRDHQTHQKIKKERYDFETPREQVIQYESQKEDASGQDNSANTLDQENDDQFYGYEKVGDIRYIDRSFMDLGYIGYGDGIFLEKLDAGPNWQFS